MILALVRRAETVRDCFLALAMTARTPPPDDDVAFAVRAVAGLLEALLAELLEEAKRVLPPRYRCGSTASPFTRVSKCRCGPVQLPVQPT